MRSFLLMISLLLSAEWGWTQNKFTIERVALISTIDNTSKSVVPRLKDNTNLQNPAVSNVNNQPLEMQRPHA